MPSTVVHVALAGLIAAGLLGSAFDRRALLVVFAVTVFPDLDSVVALVLTGTHRAAFHTFLIPLGLGALVFWDGRVRTASWLLTRYGEWGIRVAWVSVGAYVFAAIGLDLFTALGVNVLYPVHDQFYTITGNLKYSPGGGWSQTFVDLGPPGANGQETVDPVRRGSTREVHVGTGVDPTRGKEASDVVRHFPIAFGGWQLFLIVTSAIVLTAKLRLSEGPGGRDD